jgi:TP901-1 family phage major tail protein
MYAARHFSTANIFRYLQRASLRSYGLRKRRHAMAAQKGRDILLKLSDGAPLPAFVTVAGLRARTVSLNARSIDITDSESDGWRQLLEGAGVRAMAISGSGVFRDQASDALIRAAFFAQSPVVWQIIIPSFACFTGPFLIASLDYAGAHDAEATFSLSLASAGEVSFAAL